MRLCVGACVGAGMCVCACAHAYEAHVQIHSRTKVDSLTTVPLLCVYTVLQFEHMRGVLAAPLLVRGLSFDLWSAPCSEHPPTSRITHCVPWYDNKPHNTTGHAKCLFRTVVEVSISVMMRWRQFQWAVLGTAVASSTAHHTTNRPASPTLQHHAHPTFNKAQNRRRWRTP